MQVATNSFVVLGALTTLSLVGCNSRPSGSQPNAGISLSAETVSEAVAPPDSAGDNNTTVEVGTDKMPDERVGSKLVPPVIVQLKSRHHTILIHTGSDGPRFTVASLDGTVLAAALTGDEMQAQHPEIYETYKGSFARYEGTLDASNYLDARAPLGPAPRGR